MAPDVKWGPKTDCDTLKKPQSQWGVLPVEGRDAVLAMDLDVQQPLLLQQNALRDVLLDVAMAVTPDVLPDVLWSVLFVLLLHVLRGGSVCRRWVGGAGAVDYLGVQDLKEPSADEV